MTTKFNFIVFIILFAFMGTTDLYAQSKASITSIKVYGNCVMCKNRIETALDYPGIKSAQWDPETKVLKLIYNNRKISEKQIHGLVASTGHDTDSVKADDEVYAKLPFCCLYRDHDHSNIQDDTDSH